jgi:hypothetical protein
MANDGFFAINTLEQPGDERYNEKLDGDPAALSIVWRAALGVLVPSTSMRPFISLSCSREHDRLKGGASVLCLVPGAVLR